MKTYKHGDLLTGAALGLVLKAKMADTKNYSADTFEKLVTGLPSMVQPQQLDAKSIRQLKRAIELNTHPDRFDNALITPADGKSDFKALVNDIRAILLECILPDKTTSFDFDKNLTTETLEVAFAVRDNQLNLEVDILPAMVHATSHLALYEKERALSILNGAYQQFSAQHPSQVGTERKQREKRPELELEVTIPQPKTQKGVPPISSRKEDEGDYAGVIFVAQNLYETCLRSAKLAKNLDDYPALIKSIEYLEKIIKGVTTSNNLQFNNLKKGLITLRKSVVEAIDTHHLLDEFQESCLKFEYLSEQSVAKIGDLRKTLMSARVSKDTDSVMPLLALKHQESEELFEILMRVRAVYQDSHDGFIHRMTERDFESAYKPSVDNKFWKDLVQQYAPRIVSPANLVRLKLDFESFENIHKKLLGLSKTLDRASSESQLNKCLKTLKNIELEAQGSHIASNPAYHELYKSIGTSAEEKLSTLKQTDELRNNARFTNFPISENLYSKFTGFSKLFHRNNVEHNLDEQKPKNTDPSNDTVSPNVNDKSSKPEAEHFNPDLWQAEQMKQKIKERKPFDSQAAGYNADAWQVEQRKQKTQKDKSPSSQAENFNPDLWQAEQMKQKIKNTENRNQATNRRPPPIPTRPESAGGVSTPGGRSSPTTPREQNESIPNRDRPGH